MVQRSWRLARPSNLPPCTDTTTTFGGFIALQNLLSNGGPPPAIVSLGYLSPRRFSAQRPTRTLKTSISRRSRAGVSIFVAAGDAGAASL